MKILALMGTWCFGILFWIAVASIAFDDLYDLHLLAGVVGVIVGVVTLPLTFFVLPIYLALAYGNWTGVLATYCALPLIGFLHFQCAASTRSRAT